MRIPMLVALIAIAGATAATAATPVKAEKTVKVHHTKTEKKADAMKPAAK